MAYQENVISNLSDIPPLVYAFANTVGFVVTGTTATPLIRNPNYGGVGVPGGLTFALTVANSAPNSDLVWTATSSIGGITPSSRIRSPILATDGAPTTPITSTPTKVFLIGMLTPQPYLAIVVEYGYNLHRHLYLGFMEKIGPYLGGEVLSAENGPVASSSSSTTNLMSASVKTHLFSSHQSLFTPVQGAGGVHVSHADNANAWRSFYNDNSVIGAIDSAVFDGSEAMGGFGDAINDPLVAKSINALTGSSLLHPINLYATQPVTGAMRFRPIGRPAGVRLCNIRDIEAQAISTISTETWRIFAATSKQDSDDEPRAGTTSGVRYRKSESSGHLGYAYRSA